MNVTILGAGAPILLKTDGSQTLLELLRGQSLAPDAPCGGRGACKKCRVTVTGAVSAPTAQEEAAVRDGRRLACQCYPAGDCTVTVSDRGAAVVCTTGAGRSFALSPRAGLGAAVDIGTTTVVLYLYDLSTGALLATRSGMNAQRDFGADVISRICHCNENPDGLDTLAAAIRNQLAGLLAEACAQAGAAAEDVVRVTIAGNTVMQHIFARLHPRSIAAAPFTPLSLFGSWAPGTEFGLPGEVYLAPCVAGYVGGDVTAGLLASGASRDAGPCLFLDVGTNGEMAIVQHGRIVSCATAAGPAFEGAEISCGMAARAGAIDRVWLEGGSVRCHVLSDAPAEGVCGSGLVDALAVMLTLGAVDETGRLLPPDEAPDAALPYLSEDDDDVKFTLSGGVSVSAADVRKLQLAKAAVAAGIATLLDAQGIAAEELTALYLAGGFGSYLDKYSAARIGLFPSCLTEKLIACGNSAGAGAAAALRSDDALAELAALSAAVEYLELSGSRTFSDAYIDAMEFEE